MRPRPRFTNLEGELRSETDGARSLEAAVLQETRILRDVGDQGRDVDLARVERLLGEVHTLSGRELGGEVVRRRVRVEQVDDVRAQDQTLVAAHLDLMLDVQVRLVVEGQTAIAPAAQVLNREVVRRDDRHFAGPRDAGSTVPVEAEGGSELRVVVELDLHLMGAVGGQESVLGDTLPVEHHDGVVVRAAHVGARAAVFVRLSEAGVVAVQPAPHVGGAARPAVGHALVEAQLDRVVVALRLGHRDLGSVGEGVGGHERSFARISDHVDFVLLRVQGARVLDHAVELLVDVADAHGEHLGEFTIGAEHEFLRLVGLQVRIEGVLAERRVTEVDRSADQTARARGRAARGVEGRPVGGVQRVVVLEPLVAAEAAAGQFQLGDVVEDAPAAVDLRLAVAADVPGEAGARRELVLEAELDRGLREAVRRIGEVRHVLVLRADAEVDGQLVVDRPRILQEDADVVRIDVPLRDEAQLGTDSVAADLVVAIGSAARGVARDDCRSQNRRTRFPVSPVSTSFPI